MVKTKLKKVRLTDITVGKRFRTDYGDIDELAADIKKRGIIQPLTVNAAMELQAGGRRYAAAQIAEVEWVPVLVREIKDELDDREIELVENVQRKDFTWQERVSLTEAIHELYKQRESGWTQQKTADTLGRSIGSINRHLELGAALKMVPELSQCKTEDDAVKAWKRAQERVHINKLREQQKAALESLETADPTEQEKLSGTQYSESQRKIYQYAANHYIIGDAFEGLEQTILRFGGADSNIRFIECDPPYAIDLVNVKRDKSNSKDYNEVSKDDYGDFLKRLASLTYKAAGKNSWMVFWYGPTWHTEVFAALRHAGWTVNDIPGIWVKPTGQTLQPDTNLSNCYEPFAICRKGNPMLAKPGTPNVFHAPHVPANQKYHPTQRPMDLMIPLVETFCYPNTIAISPFLGSGTTLRACYHVGVNAFGWDLSDYYKDRFLLEVVKDDE